MAQPQKYEREHDFTKDEVGEISTSSLNAEFDNAGRSINALRDNLAKIQKDDGSVVNETIGIEQLKTEVVTKFTQVTADNAGKAADSAVAALESEKAAKQAADSARSDADSIRANAEATANNAQQVAEDRSAVNIALGQMRPAIDNIEDVKTVAQNIDDVKTVSANIASVNTVAGIQAEVVEVHENSENIRTVAASDPQIRDVSANMPDVRKVAGDLESSLPTGASISYGSITDPLQQEQQTTGGAIKTVADNIGSVRQAASNAQKAQSARDEAVRASEEAQTAQALAKKWATEKTTAIEGGLFGARYYAEVAQSYSSNAGNSATAAKASETNAQKSAEQAATQATAAKSSAADAATSAQDLGAAKQAAEAAASSAEASMRSAASAATSAAQSATAAAASQASATSSATAAASSADEAKKYADQSASGQIQADWTEKDETAKGFIQHKPEEFPPSKHSHEIADVNQLTEKLAALEENSAGADSVMLAQQLVGFYNGLTGESLDYRDFVDMPASELLETLYAFGRGYQGETTGG